MSVIDQHFDFKNRWEYNDIGSRLIITPAIENCWLNISMALKLNKRAAL